MPDFIILFRKQYATGHGHGSSVSGPWTKDPTRAFVFSDQVAGKGPFANGLDWAEAHAKELRSKMPKDERDAVHVRSADVLEAKRNG